MCRAYVQPTARRKPTHQNAGSPSPGTDQHRTGEELRARSERLSLDQIHLLNEAQIDALTAENAVSPFVIGRKSWLFRGSVRGVRASANLYSLIGTAKANSLELSAYLQQEFPELSKADTVDVVADGCTTVAMILADNPATTVGAHEVMIRAENAAGMVIAQAGTYVSCGLNRSSHINLESKTWKAGHTDSTENGRLA